MLAVSADVVLRYFLHKPLGWTLEVSEYAIVYITFLGTTWVLRKGGHVNIDLVLVRLNQRGKALLTIISSSLAAIACLLVTWYGVQVTWEHFQSGYYVVLSLLRPPTFPILAIIPLGSFLLSVQFLRTVYGSLRKWEALANKEEGSHTWTRL